MVSSLSSDEVRATEKAHPAANSINIPRLAILELERPPARNCSGLLQYAAYAKSGGIQGKVWAIEDNRFLTTSSRADSWTFASSAAVRLTVMSR